MEFVGLLAAIYIPLWTLITLVAFIEKEENLSEKSTTWKGGAE